jgi:hypothetical protein
MKEDGEEEKDVLIEISSCGAISGPGEDVGISRARGV